NAEAQPLGERKGALARLVLAGQDAKKRRLARAVRPDQPITVARIELHRDAGKQSLRAERRAQVGNGDHRAGNDSRCWGRGCEGRASDFGRRGQAAAQKVTPKISALILVELNSPYVQSTDPFGPAPWQSTDFRIRPPLKVGSYD